MSWNHRILAHRDGDEFFFQIHEVHYDTDGKPRGYGAPCASVCGNTIDGIKWTLDKMSKCIEKPVLSVENFPEVWIG